MKLKIPYFDGYEVELFDPLDMKDLAVVEFFKRGTSDRLKDSRHVFQYYRDFHAIVGGQDWLDAQMGVVTRAEDIWQHVTPGPLFLMKGHDPDQSTYVVMEAECDWEEEHGLMMVWKDGKYLSKVGGYDGHVSNADAHDNDELSDVVYSASDPKFTTYR